MSSTWSLLGPASPQCIKTWAFADISTLPKPVVEDRSTAPLHFETGWTALVLLARFGLCHVDHLRSGPVGIGIGSVIIALGGNCSPGRCPYGTAQDGAFASTEVRAGRGPQATTHRSADHRVRVDLSRQGACARQRYNGCADHTERRPHCPRVSPIRWHFHWPAPRCG